MKAEEFLKEKYKKGGCYPWSQFDYSEMVANMEEFAQQQLKNCNLHNVSGSDSIKSCQNCTFYTSDKNRCNHKYWSWCVKRDDEGYVTSYAYHHFR